VLELLAWRRSVHELYAAVRAEIEPAAAHGLWRAGRDELFATSPESPVGRTSFAGLAVAAYDPAYRALVGFEPTAPQRIDVPTGTDGVVAFERAGVLRTPWGELDAWRLLAYGGGLWVPVRDPSPETYGGGRYLLDTVKGADLGAAPDGRLVIDLNFLYNPSCAYDAAWACPLAPPGNVLDVPIPVGELAYPTTPENLDGQQR
jgi:uncharacterized protein (DUF1684 family)